MVEPLRHRQTKGAETDMPDLTLPRHFPTLPDPRLVYGVGPLKGGAAERQAARLLTRAFSGSIVRAFFMSGNHGRWTGRAA